MTDPDVGWDDDRLASAFAARAAAWPGRPTGLDREVLEAIRARSGSAARRPRWAWSLVGLAAVLIVATAVGVRTILPLVPAASEHPTTSGPATAASGSPGPTASIGEPITVSAALSLRNATGDDREIAVAGFLSDDPVLPCPFVPGPENPTLIHCPETFQWLMERPEILWSTSGGETHGGPPVGPAFHPSFAIVDSPIPRNARPMSAPPMPVVLIGHFHDRRSALCRADPPPDPPCSDTFVVDRVALADGAERRVATRLDNERFDAATQAQVTEAPVSTSDDIDALVAAAAPGGTILSRQVLTGERLGAVEPALASDAGWTGQRLVWLGTMASVAGDRLVPRTFLIIDGTSVVDEITASGVVTVGGSPPPSSAPSAPETGALRDLLAHPITVSEAIDRRNHNLDDTEIAVRGFGWALNGIVSCPMIRPGMAALDQCPAGWNWLAERVPPPAHGPEFLQPDGPAFHILAEPETSYGIRLSDTPTDLIAVGHFDDHRATACPADLVDRCRTNFILDALLDPTARVIGPMIKKWESGQPATVASAAEAIDVATVGSRGPAFVVSVVAIRGAAVPSIEPIASAAPQLVGAPVVWVVRFLDRFEGGRPVLETRLVVDGPPSAMAGSVYVLLADGVDREVTIIN